MRRGADTDQLPLIALTPARAAKSLSISEDLFNQRVRPSLRLVRLGRKVLVPVSEIERWVEREAEATLEDR